LLVSPSENRGSFLLAPRELWKSPSMCENSSDGFNSSTEAAEILGFRPSTDLACFKFESADPITFRLEDTAKLQHWMTQTLSNVVANEELVAESIIKIRQLERSFQERIESLENTINTFSQQKAHLESLTAGMESKCESLKKKIVEVEAAVTETGVSAWQHHHAMADSMRRMEDKYQQSLPASTQCMPTPIASSALAI